MGSLPKSIQFITLMYLKIAKVSGGGDVSGVVSGAGGVASGVFWGI